MMKKWIMLCLVVLFSVSVGGVALSADQAKEGKAQTVCPVMGGEINKDVFVDYQGKRIYFCCEACPEQFLKDPDKYLKKMEEEGVVLEKSPVEEPKKQ